MKILTASQIRKKYKLKINPVEGPDIIIKMNGEFIMSLSGDLDNIKQLISDNMSFIDKDTIDSICPPCVMVVTSANGYKSVTVNQIGKSIN